ncbi:MAG: TIGR02710 family CRISPR-associated CARF protein [Pseudomonadota bacterium]|nr:TIGR02710 family CRISPR-associated CARF protein [Pseudomonadota bacterium]
MTEQVLVCTVGGSHQPILTALRELRPDFVLFLCTGKDPATGRPGSVSQITGKGKPVEQQGDDGTIEKLPNIPTQAGLPAERFAVREVPADDLDAAVAIILDAIADLLKRFPDAAFVADYTGGTKTMTAALVMAALESEGVDLQLVTGAREDLVRVHDGSQYGFAVGTEGIRLRRAMAPYLSAWARFAYGEAAQGLAELGRPLDAQLRAELQIATDLSYAFDAWDRFDHPAAIQRLGPYRSRVGKTHARLLTFLECLAGTGENPRRAPARLWDLWLNAQRRARQGRYDDAVARVYRLLEWVAQWLLAGKGILTANIAHDQIPEGMQITPNRDGKLQAGLVNAWELVAHYVQGPAREFAIGERNRMRNHLLVRNGSILAHGETPVDGQAWRELDGWVQETLLPVLTEESVKVGLRVQPPQLPDSRCW